MEISIPKTVGKVVKKLETAGFEVFVVGGCVRDLLLENPPAGGPKDWDLTTNAKPEEILAVFPDGKNENDFGTVLVPEKYLGNEEAKGVIEITTYRIESKYSDKRHPDKVKFAKTLEEDLSRRDFCINAMALKISKPNPTADGQNPKSKIKLQDEDYEIVDLFGGREDLKAGLIRAVGKAEERFDEDALRMMRAVRFVCQLSEITKSKLQNPNKNQDPKTKETKTTSWTIEKKTFNAIKSNADNLKFISKERIRDEFEKIILSDQPAQGVEMLVELGLMKYIIPEVLDAVGIRQNRHHYHGPYNTVYKHMLASLEKCPSEKLEVRLAAFLHDIGKPATKRGKGIEATFHGHEYLGAKMVQRIMERLKFSRKVVDRTVLLVQNHMFYYNVDEVGESGVRRVVRKVGLENINDLIDVRIGDRLGSGVPKAVPYKLRHFKYMVEKVSKDPISVGQLKLKGDELMKSLEMEPGPKVGAILEVLLSRVLDDPKLNNKDDLIVLARGLQEENLEKLRFLAKEKIKNEQTKEDKEVKDKYWVK
jgi:tRNA nucleotidyltransferase (CCA-adding enzyme)